MNTRTLAVGIGFLVTLIATLGMTNPDGLRSTQDQTTEIETSKIEYIHKTMEIDGQKYKWTIIIPPSAVKGGAGILFLHGRGSGGQDGKHHLEVGLPKAIESDPQVWPFIIIAPQKNSAGDWDFHESAVMKMLDEAIEEEYIDPDNIGITGLSQGGHGSLLFASLHPDRFSAVAPVCGYAHVAFDKEGNQTPFPSIPDYLSSTAEIAKKISDIPVWLFHGDEDSVVPAISSRIMNQKLESMDADVKYTEFPGVDHNSWDPAYAKKELGKWFSKHLQN